MKKNLLFKGFLVVYVTFMVVSIICGIKREVEAKEIEVTEKCNYCLHIHKKFYNRSKEFVLVNYADSEGRLITLTEKMTEKYSVEWNNEDMKFVPSFETENEVFIYVNGELIETEEELNELDNPEAIIEVLEGWASL